MVEFRERLLAEPLAGSLLESMPCPVLVLDEQQAVVHANAHARQWLGVDEGRILGRGPGDLLDCLEARPGGCGSAEDCRLCLLRRGSEVALAGRPVQQQEVRLAVDRGRGPREVTLLLSASPLSFEGRRLVVVVLQDPTPQHRLSRLLPICSSCKRIRREDQSWTEVEAVLQEASGQDLTHSICPRCIEEHYPEYSDRLDADPT